MDRYDIIYGADRVTIAPHFCREITYNGDGEEIGCYGTNPMHGFTLEQACASVAAYYEHIGKPDASKLWAERKHPDLLHYPACALIEEQEDEANTNSL